MKMLRSHRHVFTVFTPTFNRSHTLMRVYCNLKRQTFTDFEWLIVDDGSTDLTYEIVSQWIRTAPFQIRYFYQQNSGKHVAINRGVKLAKGELFLIADSDDTFLGTTLERFYFHWNTIPQSIRGNFSSVTCHCMDERGNAIGKRFPYDPTDSDSEEILFRYKVTGEKWGFLRTDVLMEFPFPEVRTKYFPEFYIWSRIAKKYKTRFVNEYLRVYHQDAGGQLMKQSFEDVSSRRFFYADSLNISRNWFKYAPIRFFKNGIQYVRLCLWGKDRTHAQWERLNCITSRCIWFFSIVPGFILWAIDKIRVTTTDR